MYLTRWRTFDRGFDQNFAGLDLLRRRMNDLFRNFDWPYAAPAADYADDATWPRANLYDTGGELVLYAAVPGVAEKDLKITATGDVLTVAGTRPVAVPEGYSVHRQERGSRAFARSFTLPCRVDVEKTTATLKDGMLTLRLTKAADAQPRQITVKAGR